MIELEQIEQEYRIYAAAGFWSVVKIDQVSNATAIAALFRNKGDADIYCLQQDVEHILLPPQLIVWGQRENEERPSVVLEFYSKADAIGFCSDQQFAEPETKFWIKYAGKQVKPNDRPFYNSYRTMQQMIDQTNLLNFEIDVE